VSPVPPYSGGGGGGGGSYPPGGLPLQFLGLDTFGDPAWLTAPYANYVYNTSVAPGGSRFDDWSDLMDAIALISGPKSITFEQNETIPAGAWDLHGVTLSGNFLPVGGGAVVVTFAEGATISDTTNMSVREGLLLTTESSSPVVTITGPGTFDIIVVDTNSGVASKNAPFFFVDDSANFVLAVLNGGGGLCNALAGADGGQQVVEVTATAGFAAVSLSGIAARMDDDTLVGAAPYFLRLIQGVGINHDAGLVQPNFAGPIIDQFFTDARNLGYNPGGTGGVLTATDVQAAIDELAGLV
jgi:hypothetical protein